MWVYNIFKKVEDITSLLNEIKHPETAKIVYLEVSRHFIIFYKKDK